jgi:hypothetical protein
MNYVASITNDPERQKQVNADLLNKIKTQLVTNHDAASDLNRALAPGTPKAYGILQAASAFFCSRKPFFTQTSSKSVQAVWDYYQLLQLRLSILVTNYEASDPEHYSPQTIQDLVIDRIAGNIAAQRTLVKPPLPPGTFIDLRTDKNPTMMIWGSPTWVNGSTLQHYCVDGLGVRHRFYVLAGNLTCDPPGHDSAKLGAELATEDQFKSLLDGWKGDTPLAWVQKETGLKMTAAPETTKTGHVGFYWVGRTGTPANRAGPVEGPFCKTVCLNDNTLGMYEYIHRYDMKDTSTPSPDAWTTSLGQYDPGNYNANAELAPKPVEEGQYFWPVGGN